MKFKLNKAVLPLAKCHLMIIMRLFVFFMSLTIFGINTSNSFSQEKVIIEEDQLSSVDEVFKIIKKQTSYRFIYPKKAFKKAPKIHLKKGELTVQELLILSLKGKNFEFVVKDDNSIFINKIKLTINDDDIRKPLQKIVSGTIVDIAGVPLPGANVLEKGTTNGAQSDFDGKFTLNVSSEDLTLIVSYLGFLTQEIKVSEQTNIDIVLLEDVASLNEVVVIGYGTQKKADVTGAVSTIKNERLTISPIASTSNSLVGQIPGLVSRQTSGEPGKDGANISIRGFGESLVIVDGVQRSFNDLDPNSIESITVLKDGSAAIFGARAGNGVILVTTKRGNNEKMKLQLNSSYSLQGFANFPEPLSAGQWTELWLESEINDGRSTLTFTEEDVQKYYEGTDPEYPSTNWFDVGVRDWSPQINNNISVRGGNDKLSYYGLLGMISQEGFVKTGDHVFNRYNVISNVDANISENLKVSMNLSIINSDLIAPQRSSTNDNTGDGRNLYFQDLFTTEPIHPSSYPDPTKIPNTDSPYNPIANASIDIAGYRERRITNTNIAGVIEYKTPFLDGLTAKLLVNHVQNDLRNKAFIKSFETYNYDYENDVYTPVVSGEPTSLTQSYQNNTVLTTQISLNYKKEFGKHKLSLLALYESIDDKEERFSGSRTNFLTTSIDQLFAGGSEDQNITGTAAEFGRISYVSRFDYSYDKKYLLQLSARYDASAKFAPENRWGFFPSALLGWRISEESFLKENPTINNLKLRLSYSRLGFDDVGNFQFLSGFDINGTGVIFGNEVIPGLASTGLANPNISWEELTIYNIGLDFGLFSNKVTGEFNLFYRDRKGILATRIGSLPNTFGLTASTLPEENINEQSNRGFEFVLGTRGSSGNFKYTIDSNISWTRAKWEKFDEPEFTDPNDIRIRQNTGNWVNRMIGFKSDGLFTSQEEIDNHAVQDNAMNLTLRPGDIKYVDISGPDGIPDGIIDDKDRTLIGRSAVPEIFFGLFSNLQYKNFDLSFLIQGATNSTLRVTPTLYISPRFGTPEVYRDRWTPANNNSNARFPRRTGSVNNNNKLSDFWTVDGTYARLKTLSLGYTLTEVPGFDKIRLSVSGTNLFTIDKGASELGIDPEIPGGGPGGFYYPPQRTFSLNINLAF